MSLAPSISVKWHSDCLWWNFTLFILHSLQYVQEWLQLSATCNLLDLEGVCPEPASLPLLTWNQLQNLSAISPIHKQDWIEFQVHCCELIGNLRIPIFLVESLHLFSSLLF
jgi:hypothetical protein